MGAYRTGRRQIPNARGNIEGARRFFAVVVIPCRFTIEPVTLAATQMAIKYDA